MTEHIYLYCCTDLLINMVFNFIEINFEMTGFSKAFYCFKGILI